MYIGLITEHFLGYSLLPFTGAIPREGKMPTSVTWLMRFRLDRRLVGVMKAPYARDRALDGDNARALHMQDAFDVHAQRPTLNVRVSIEHELQALGPLIVQRWLSVAFRGGGYVDRAPRASGQKLGDVQGSSLTHQALLGDRRA